MRLELDKSSDAPLYLQLADAIRVLVQTGELKPGDKLPTVRALFNETGLSDGTIRHAYDLLAREGVLDMSQGRGTFVCEPGSAIRSRQVRAMQSIDEMFERLAALSFTPREIQLFLNVKLAQVEGESALTPVALVDCNPESLNEAAQQLSAISGIALTEYLLDDVRRAPLELTKDMRLVITTQSHAHELTTLLGGDNSRIARMVLSPSAHTLAALSRIEAGQSTLIYCHSARFSQIVKTGIRLFPHLRYGDVPVLLAGDGEAIAPLIADMQALIVSPDYLSYTTTADCKALTAFADAGGLIIPYHHQIDQGSLLYIEERIRAL